jgi:hypothetical protein
MIRIAFPSPLSLGRLAERFRRRRRRRRHNPRRGRVTLADRCTTNDLAPLLARRFRLKLARVNSRSLLVDAALARLVPEDAAGSTRTRRSPSARLRSRGSHRRRPPTSELAHLDRGARRCTEARSSRQHW